MRNGVDKSERNEINRAILLPVRQPIRSETNIRVRIEKAEFCHRNTKCIKPAWARKTPKQEAAIFNPPLLRDGGLETAAPWTPYSKSSTSSSSRRSNNFNVLSMGAGVVMSTPAVFNVSNGNFDPPERKKLRYASTLPSSPDNTRCESAAAAEIPVEYL